VSRGVLLGGRRRRRRRPGRLALLAALAALAGSLALAANAGPEAERAGGPAQDTARARGGAPRLAPPQPAPDALRGDGGVRSPFAVRLAGTRDLLRVPFRRPPRAGLLFDVDTGRVLWRRAPERRLPIASLTKMMTALVVAERLPRGAKVRISAHALRYRGSGVGRLPRGRRVGVEALLHGLLLASGNDAARALAEGAGGSIRRFVGLMNREAARLGLRCTRFRSPDGLRGGSSCPPDLAALGRAVLATPRLARIVRRPRAILPFPIKGGRLHLATTNPLLRQGYRGTTGIKTGYTRPAGRCLVASARRGRRHLAVVLLRSPDPGRQAAQLLDRGFRALRRRA